MSDEQGPFLWENRDVPPYSCDEQRLLGNVKPPAGFMLHSWQISPIGGLVICWVRMRFAKIPKAQGR